MNGSSDGTTLPQKVASLWSEAASQRRKKKLLASDLVSLIGLTTRRLIDRDTGHRKDERSLTGTFWLRWPEWIFDGTLKR